MENDRDRDRDFRLRLSKIVWFRVISEYTLKPFMLSYF